MILTKEQIKQLLAITSNKSTSKDLYDELCEWNEKQPFKSFDIDWNNAPSHVVSATINLEWVTDAGYSIFCGVMEIYDKPAPVTTPHPHADIMMKYAEVAAKRVDPWVEFELKSGDDKWVKVHQFSFDAHLEYRHIGDDKCPR